MVDGKEITKILNYLRKFCSLFDIVSIFFISVSSEVGSYFTESTSDVIERIIW